MAKLAFRFLFIIFLLLPFVLLSLGFYLVNLPTGADIAGIKQVIWFGIGQSIIASAIVALVTLIGTWAERSAERANENSLANRVKELMNAEEGLLERIDKFQRIGLHNVYPARDMREVYQKHQETVSERLDLLGMSLSHFQDDVGAELINWVRARPKLHIRLMVINPTSPYCTAREQEEHVRQPGEIASGAIELTKMVLELQEPRIQIRWYNSLPMLNIFRLDEVVFIGTYVIGQVSRKTPTLELDVRKSLAHQFIGHFDQLWGPSNAISQWSVAPTFEDLQTAVRHYSGRH